ATDGRPCISKTFFVGVSVLRDDRGDPLGMGHGKSKAGWCAVVKHIEGVVRELQSFGEGFNRFGDGLKGVDVIALGRDLREAEARKIRRDNVVAVSEARDELAVLEGGGREAVKEQ